MKSPIEKLLVSINQSNSGYMIYFFYKLFKRNKEANIYEIKSRRQRLKNWSFCIFLVLFSRKITFSMKKTNSSQKVVIIDGQDDIDIDDIGNLQDLPKLVINYDECGNLKVVDWRWIAY